jgi:hypothetical protein
VIRVANQRLRFTRITDSAPNSPTSVDGSGVVAAIATGREGQSDLICKITEEN